MSSSVSKLQINDHILSHFQDEVYEFETLWFEFIYSHLPSLSKIQSGDTMLYTFDIVAGYDSYDR